MEAYFESIGVAFTDYECHFLFLLFTSNMPDIFIHYNVPHFSVLAEWRQHESVFRVLRTQIYVGVAVLHSSLACHLNHHAGLRSSRKFKHQWVSDNSLFIKTHVL